MDQTFTLNKKIKPTSREDLEKLDKNELIEHILRLEKHNYQLGALLQKSLADNDVEKTKNKSKSKRVFDFSKTHKRHVLLKLLYFGWDYQGFARQSDTHKTIEHQLFEALKRTCLIESPQTCNYQRCGRTDKGVSAFCQVVSIDLRSKFAAAEQMLETNVCNEIDYCGILNNVLPENIQCIAWMPLRSMEYSARFDCLERTYRYYFPKANLKLEPMRAACKLLERHADFRNFCKMDVQNGVTNFVRHVKSANIEVLPAANDENGYALCYLEIRANAFLLHQIRCIMSILLLVGQGKEEPTIVDELLDVEKQPCKPQYGLASGIPLNLFKCDFKSKCSSSQNVNASNSENDESDTTSWIYNQNSLVKLVQLLQSQWTLSAVRTTMIRNVLDELRKTLGSVYDLDDVHAQVTILQDNTNKQQYTKLLNRKRCESLENRIEHFVKKQRLIAAPKGTKS